MLSIWILFVAALGLILIAIYKLFMQSGLIKGALSSGTVNAVSANIYPMRLTSGRTEYELIISYSYSVGGNSYTGVDKIRTTDVNRYEKIKFDYAQGAKVNIKVSSYSDSVSCIFFDKKILIASIILLLTGILLASSLWQFI